MVKGFVFFRDGKIPFVIEDYCMELFTDDNLLKDFTKEHNFKNNYILQGQYFGDGFQAQKAIFLVERSIGNNGYLDKLFVHKDYQRIGIATAIVNELELQAVFSGIHLFSTQASITAKPFFERRIYHVVRENTVVRCNVKLKNYIMEKNEIY